MRTVFKFILNDPFPLTFSLTKLSATPVIQVLSCSVQGSGSDRLKIWVETETSWERDSCNSDFLDRLILLAGTGSDLSVIRPAGRQYITTILDDGLVWHAFLVTGQQKVLATLYRDYVEKRELHGHTSR